MKNASRRTLYLVPIVCRRHFGYFSQESFAMAWPAQVHRIGSSALKAMAVAEGAVDIYPCFSPTR